MVEYRWSEEKNEWLKEHRELSFEIVVEILNSEAQQRIFKHPNKKKYPKQKIYLIKINNYVYMVPFIIEKNRSIFLKTIIPSRKYNNLFKDVL